MRLFEDMRELVCSALVEELVAVSPSVNLEEITVQRPRDDAHGDLTTNAALVVARNVGASPRSLAAKIAARLEKDARVDAASVAGPGFINFRLAPRVWSDMIDAILREGGEFGRGAEERGGIALCVGPLGVSAAPSDDGFREAVVADILARLLRFAGWSVGSACRNAMPAGAASPMLAKAGLAFDAIHAEAELASEGRIEAALDVLAAKGLISEKAGATLFCSTVFGDDDDRVVRLAGGEWTALALDIAFLAGWVDGHARRLVKVVRTNGGGEDKKITAAAAALCEGETDIDVVLVRPLGAATSDGAGGVSSVQRLIDETGLEGLRFAIAERQSSRELDLDQVALREPSRRNGYFMAQYVHARIFAKLSQAGQSRGDDTDAPIPDVWSETLRMLSQWPEVVEVAARTLEPQRVAKHLHELSLTADDAMRAAPDIGGDCSMATTAQSADQNVLRAVLVVIAAGLGILGETPATEMR